MNKAQKPTDTDPVSYQSHNSSFEAALSVSWTESEQLLHDLYVLTQVPPKISPFSETPNLEKQRERLERYLSLVRFYRKNNVDKLKEGVGLLTDYSMNNLESLNEKLNEKYGDVLDNSPNGALSCGRGVLNSKDFGSVESIDIARISLKLKLLAFYALFDRSKVDGKNPSTAGFSDIYKYALKRGEKDLNVKLRKKYTVDLNDFSFESGFNALTSAEIVSTEEFVSVEFAPNLDVVNPEPLKSKKKKKQNLREIIEQAKAKAQSERKLRNQGGLKQRTRGHTRFHSSSHTKSSNPGTQGFSAVKAMEEVKDNFKNDRVPEEYRAFLELFFGVYDPYYCVESIEYYYALGREEGLKRVDEDLLDIYKESLSMFQARVEKLQDALLFFLAEHDEEKAGEIKKTYLSWAVQNGVDCLNSRLRESYGVDLNGNDGATGEVELRL
eukprot:augustus_masked-scaffold_2-processed-gene-12.12-mRNA-1 protein AED:1.00 eAED:1.00 QI:0/-1/0/0/-1/1/1/0/439